MSTHHQRLAKAPADGLAVHSWWGWVHNRVWVRNTKGLVLEEGFSKDLVAFLSRRRRIVQRWIPREALRQRGQRRSRA